MNIVVVNDDGWGTAGIRLLAKEMTKLGHVTVIAPEGARSGFGAAISVVPPINLRRVEEHDLNGAEVYTTNGSRTSLLTSSSRVSTTAVTQRSIPCIRVRWVRVW